MKKIAVLGSSSGQNLKAIANYFADKSVSVVAVSDIENSDFLKVAKELALDWKFLPNEQNFEYFSSHNFDLVAISDYRSELKSDIFELGEYLNLHPSLLPSFKGADAISRAFLSGVKVSGITILRVKNDLCSGKILAQYPVLIGNLTHFDEFKSEILSLADVLYPIVIDKILNNQVFDFQDLIKGNNRNCCSGCEKTL